MIVLGLILLILGLLLPQSILTTLGIILIVVGLVLNFVGGWVTDLTTRYVSRQQKVILPDTMDGKIVHVDTLVEA